MPIKETVEMKNDMNLKNKLFPKKKSLAPESGIPKKVTPSLPDKAFESPVAKAPRREVKTIKTIITSIAFQPAGAGALGGPSFLSSAIKIHEV
jgi:hypothetical protein